MQKFTEDQLKRQDFVGRQVPRKSRFVGGAKGHNVEENTLPGSAALWAGSFK